jgi:hypothetical protein
VSIKKAKQQTKFVVLKALDKTTNEDADEQRELAIRVRVRRTCWDDSEAGIPEINHHYSNNLFIIKHV